MPQSEYSSTYGLVTLNGLPKATFHAFEFLNRLGSELYRIEADAELPSGCGWCATRLSETIQVLLWHQVLPEIGVQEPWEIRLSLPVTSSGNHLVIQSRIAVNHGSAWETWMALGQPQNLSTEEMRLLRNRAQPEYGLIPFPAAEGSVHLDVSIQPAEVLLLEFRRKGATSLPKSGLRAQLAQWEQQMSDASKA
jgi:xylan 1,4-beta-xylosidase